MIGGVRYIVSDHAVQDTDERLFPASKNRSRRIHKKLVKRFGGEFRKGPCAYQIGGKIVIHPVLYAQMKLRERVEKATYSVLAGRNPWS